MKYTASYKFKLQCNAAPRHWRDRMGQSLREWAELLDGRRTLAVDMASDPPVSVAIQSDVLRKGLEHMGRLLKNAVADECSERLLKKAAPHLFDV